MIEFRTLGSIQLHDSESGNSLNSILAQPKRVALLAYLALAKPRSWQRRDALLGMFWPETDDSRGRAALSQALYVLRRSLGDAAILTRGDEEISLSSDVVWCDAVAFHDALASGHAHQALELYGGELLAGFHVSDSVEFDRWLEAERARTREAAASAAWSVADSEERSGNRAQAAHFARKAMSLLPYDEDALRRGLSLLERAGDRSGALHEYEAFARRFRDDLELEISAETCELIERIRSASTAASDRDVATETMHSELAAIGTPRVRSLLSWRRLLPYAAVVALLAVVGTVTLRSENESAPRADRVLVTEFVNETRDNALGPLGRIAADWVAQGLAQTGLVDVVPAVTAFRSAHALELGVEPNTVPQPQRLAEESNAATVISGSYYLERDSIHLQGLITEAASGKILRALGRVSAPRADPMVAVELLRQRALGALASLRDERLESWAATASQPPSFEAYRAYADGLNYFFTATDEGQRESVKHFRKAAAEDSTFTAPLIWAIFAYKNTFQFAQADSLAQRLELARERLAPWDRAVLNMHQADLRGDRRGAYEAAKRVATLTPDSEWRFLHAHNAMRINRPREALDVLLKMDPERGWIRTWPFYWVVRLQARHVLEQYNLELSEQQRAVQLHPQERLLQFHDIRAHAALGRVEEANARADDVAAVFQRLASPLEPYIVLANELRAHGRHREAQRVAERALALQSSTAGQDNLDRLFLLLAAGRWQQLRAAIEEIRRTDHRPPIVVLGLAGVAAAALGDRAAAERIDAELAAIRRPFSGLVPLQRAGIAAQLGDQERAVQLLRQALKEGMWFDLRTHANPTLLPLANYPPYQKLWE